MVAKILKSIDSSVIFRIYPVILFSLWSGRSIGCLGAVTKIMRVTLRHGHKVWFMCTMFNDERKN